MLKSAPPRSQVVSVAQYPAGGWFFSDFMTKVKFPNFTAPSQETVITHYKILIWCLTVYLFKWNLKNSDLTCFLENYTYFIL